MSDHRDLHAGKIKIQPELLRAIALGYAIKPPNLLANEPKLRRILESYFFGRGFFRGILRQFGDPASVNRRAMTYERRSCP